MEIQKILKKNYQQDDGIVMALDSADPFIVHEEELGEQMSKKLPEHVLADWELSKANFWHVVQRRESEPGTIIAYIGSGNDRAFKLFDDSIEFMNVDVVEASLRSLRNSGARNLLLASVADLPFKDGSLDAVVLVDILHHFATRDLSLVIQEVDRVLKPGGRIYIEEINALGFFRLPIAWLPLSALNALRKLKSKLIPGRHEPEAYEAPLFKAAVMKSFGEGYSFKIQPCPDYPETNRLFKFKWRLLRRITGVQENLSFHWFIIGNKNGL